jgi:V/A-type H+-transporting ATPase subunit D
MAQKFQYNKTTIQELRKQLAVREKALPILQNKETALRKEVKDRQVQFQKLKFQKEKLLKIVQSEYGFWKEFPDVLSIEKADIVYKKTIGVKVPTLKDVEFRIADCSWWHYPAWLPTGILVLKKVLTLDLNLDFLEKQIEILDKARKKTTQKVNLYEKVQIPEMEKAILKIKRFLEDKDNISKAAQKIIKRKKERREEA